MLWRRIPISRRFASTSSAVPPTRTVTLPTRAAAFAREPLLSSPQEFLSFVQSPYTSTPLVFPASSHADGRAQDLVRALRHRGETMVEVELGRYDDPAPDAFHHVPMRLGQYVDWLEDRSRAGGTVGGRQLYLAQWRAADEVSCAYIEDMSFPCVGMVRLYCCPTRDC